MKFASALLAALRTLGHTPIEGMGDRKREAKGKRRAG